jgi:hypothetical protein
VPAQELRWEDQAVYLSDHQAGSHDPTSQVITRQIDISSTIMSVSPGTNAGLDSDKELLFSFIAGPVAHR